jgi:hypothetical protein
MRTLLISVLLLLLVAGCSATDVLKGAASAALGGNNGPSLEAQIGKTNTKKVVVQETTIGRDQVTTTETVKANKVETVVINNNVPMSYFVASLLFALIGWILPTPSELGSKTLNLFRRRK